MTKLNSNALWHMVNAGAGYAGTHGVATSAAGYTAAGDAYVYAIECYTDGAKFTALQEGGEGVAAARLDAGGDGYPAGTVITGKFNLITPAAGDVVGIFIKP